MFAGLCWRAHADVHKWRATLAAPADGIVAVGLPANQWTGRKLVSSATFASSRHHDDTDEHVTSADVTDLLGPICSGSVHLCPDSHNAQLAARPPIKPPAPPERRDLIDALP